MLEEMYRRYLDQKNLTDFMQFFHDYAWLRWEKVLNPSRRTDLDWNQWCVNKREEFCREAKTLLNPEGRQLGRKRPLMGKERVTYILSKLPALEVILRSALGVKAGFEIGGREGNWKSTLLQTGTSFLDRKKKRNEKRIKKEMWTLWQEEGT